MRYWECDGLTTLEACGVLKTLASNVPADQCIVEIGVFRGRSLLALAEGSAAGNDVPVLGVDPWTLDRPSKDKYKSEETFTYVRKAVHASPCGNRITLRRDYGMRVAADWGDRPKVGLLYIDADHRRQPVLDDVKSWAPHLPPGAIIAFDDHHSDFPGVVQAVSELVASGELTSFFMATDRLAIGTWHG